MKWKKKIQQSKTRKIMNRSKNLIRNKENVSNIRTVSTKNTDGIVV